MRVSSDSGLSSLKRAVRGCRKHLLSAMGISFVINILMLTGPVFMLQIYDRVLTSRSIPTLVSLAGITLCLYLFFGILESVRARILPRVGQYFDNVLSGEMFSLSLSLPFMKGKGGRRFDPPHDLDQIRQFFSGAGFHAIFDTPWIPAYLFVVYLLHPLLCLVGILGVLIISVLIIVNQYMTRDLIKAASLVGSRRREMLRTRRDNAEVIMAMGMVGSVRSHWDRLNSEYLDANLRASDRSSLLSSIIKTLRFMLQSSVLGFGAWLAILQEISPGTMIAASIIVSRALAPVELAVGNWRGFILARHSMKSLRLALETHGSGVDSEPHGVALPIPSEMFSVEGLYASPPGGDKITLNGFDFCLRSGDGLGVIGPSGGGKSSLARVMVGIWPIFRGAVRFDGADLFQWDVGRRGLIIGYLPQSVELFDGTIGENISRFDMSASSDAVMRAARLACVHDLIVRFPDGYDTRIGEKGQLLSAGQRQRIALARCLYRDPFLVVLDEPNSNLDSEGEDALTDAISSVRARGGIVVVIAHRPSAIVSVDHLLYLVDGRQKLFGRKDDVLAKLRSSPHAAPTGLSTVAGRSNLKIIRDGGKA